MSIHRMYGSFELDLLSELVISFMFIYLFLNEPIRHRLFAETDALQRRVWRPLVCNTRVLSLRYITSFLPSTVDFRR